MHGQQNIRILYVVCDEMVSHTFRIAQLSAL